MRFGNAYPVVRDRKNQLTEVPGMAIHPSPLPNNKFVFSRFYEKFSLKQNNHTYLTGIIFSGEEFMGKSLGSGIPHDPLPGTQQVPGIRYHP